MRILDRAIGRVRRGVKDAAEASASADNTLGHALAWLGNELRGDAIPERLRDAAGRIASFIAPPSASYVQGDATRATPSVVALEDALAAKAARSTPESTPQVPADGAHARDLAGGVCPFTGLRADGTPALPVADVALQPTPAAAATPAAEPALAVEISPASKKPRRKRKERLAGAQTVENTSARSATRPAPRQPRSRAQASRKKA